MSRRSGFVVIAAAILWFKSSRFKSSAKYSELARFLARPALDHNLRFGEELHGIASLGVQNAEEALIPAGDRKIGHRRGDSDVDANISRRRFVAEPARRGAAGRKERRLVPVRAASQEFHGLVNRIGVNQAEHRAKNLRVRQLAGGRQSIKDRRREEISRF